jgi:hypothetical protein
VQLDGWKGLADLQSLLRPIDSVEEDPENARLHSERNIEAIRTSLRGPWGQTSPVVVLDGVVYAGNARLRAAKLEGWTQLAMVEMRGLTPAQARAYGIMDNQSGALAEWDYKRLGDLFRGMSTTLQGLTGFKPFEVKALELGKKPPASDGTEPGTGVAPETKWLFTKDQIKAAILELFPQPATVEEVVRHMITPAMAMGEFNKLASGKRSGYDISLLFNPHRINTPNHKSVGYIDACKSVEDFRNHAARFIAEFQLGDVHPDDFSSTLMVGVGGVQLVNEFRPWVARDIYAKHCKPGARVLDPCHGWGGRVIGWLAANLGGHYVGFDPATKTNAGVAALIKFLKQADVKSTAEVHGAPFEESKLQQNSFDFAMTSPPYFDTEFYSDEPTQSFKRYATYELWVEKFFKVLLAKTLRALKPGCSFLINVGRNRYPLHEVIKQWAESEGHVFAEAEEFDFGSSAGSLGNEEKRLPESFYSVTKKP